MPKKSKLKTKNRTPDLDEIDADLSPKRAHSLLYRPVDDDLPGGGQFYCVTCSRHFIDRQALADHRSTKLHKRRIKALQQEQPYTQADADAAAGVGRVQPSRQLKRKIVEPVRHDLALLMPDQQQLQQQPGGKVRKVEENMCTSQKGI